MVCDKVVCVKDGVWQRGGWKMVDDKVVCERWWVTKLWERWCVTKLCVKDGGWKIVCDKVVRERWCVTKWCVKDCVKDGVSKLVCERPSSASLLIPLQTVFLRTPTDAARRWASDSYSFQYACIYVLQFLHVFPGFPSCNVLISPNGFLDFLGFFKRFFQACQSVFPPV